MAEYEFVTELVRYRSVSTGRFVPRRTVLKYVDAAVSAGQDVADELARLVSSGQISPADWEQLMRQEVKATWLQEAILGKGGRSNMTSSDYGTVGRDLRDQYTLLSGFREDIEADLLSEAQISARSQQYFLASKTAFEKGQASAWGMPTLPQYPGDGNTVCNIGCKCTLLYQRQDKRTMHIFWVLSPSIENCPDCQRLSREWNPLVIIDGVIQNSASNHAPLFRKWHRNGTRQVAKLNGHEALPT